MAEMTKTYPDDLELFRRLGLDPFELPDDGSEHHVGRVPVGFGKGHVDVYVKCYPAQAWRFECYDYETKGELHLRGGTGTLSDYWPGVDLLARGQMIIEKVDLQPELSDVELPLTTSGPGPLTRPSSLAAERSLEH